ncbi:aspartoacylase [Scytonema hofmannii PCC 7110]|uniref:Probable aspartoacylase n=1 Tax=Scytonema hofmannii PCC 7110 TaxID=128403 RepID=A0A139XF59_9CYAN|nr:aspartoacylase [Scytonema hofmannii]KYC43330.1 aspartoacylase [Scytonema hofmannii PCC 7110]
MESFKKVAIMGGTHGNEFTGIYLIKKFEKFPQLVTKSSFETLTVLSNPEAFRVCRRYVDKDLNRCFVKEILNNFLGSTYEENRAKFLNQTLGPKENPQVDFILDLHTTTANMGLSIILLSNHPFNIRLAAYLSSIEPTVKIYSWIEPDKESSFLNSICERGFGIEVGPIPHGTLNAHLFEQTERLILTILDYLDQCNQNDISKIDNTVTIYQHLKTVDYPKNKNGEIEGMVHPELQGRDYEELKPGDPLFLTFDDRTIYYEEEALVYPVFINEAAYYEKGIAMCLTTKESIEFPM